MSGLSFIKINNGIRVVVPGPMGGSYLSRVEEVYDNSLIIQGLIKKNIQVDLPVGQQLHLIYNAGARIHEFDAELAKNIAGNVTMMRLASFKHFKEVQRRQYVRLGLQIPIKITMMDSSYEKYGESIKGFTSDISGGGLKIKTREPLEEGNLIETYFEIDTKRVIAIARVLRVKELKIDKEKLYIAGVQFHILEDFERERIIGFIFRKEREMRRKGLV